MLIFLMFFSDLCDSYINDTSLTVLIGDMNFDMQSQNTLNDLCELYDLENIIKTPTCFKSDSPTLLEVIISIKPRFVWNNQH